MDFDSRDYDSRDETVLRRATAAGGAARIATTNETTSGTGQRPLSRDRDDEARDLGRGPGESRESPSAERGRDARDDARWAKPGARVDRDNAHLRSWNRAFNLAFFFNASQAVLISPTGTSGSIVFACAFRSFPAGQ